MRSLDEMLASSLWTRELPPEQLERVRVAIIVRDVDAGAYVCHKGKPANVWIGVIDGLVKLESRSASGKAVTFSSVPAVMLQALPLRLTLVRRVASAAICACAPAALSARSAARPRASPGRRSPTSCSARRSSRSAS